MARLDDRLFAGDLSACGVCVGDFFPGDFPPGDSPPGGRGAAGRFEAADDDASARSSRCPGATSRDFLPGGGIRIVASQCGQGFSTPTFFSVF